MNEKMKKHKIFQLDYGMEDSWYWQIRVRIYPNGTFKHKGEIIIQERKRYRGAYKSKQFMYNQKLPEGDIVRHHTEYDDTDPNKHIVYMPRSDHTKLHIEQGDSCQWLQ